MNCIEAARNAGLIFTVAGFTAQILGNLAFTLIGYVFMLMGGVYTLSYIVLRREATES